MCIPSCMWTWKVKIWKMFPRLVPRMLTDGPTIQVLECVRQSWYLDTSGLYCIITIGISPHMSSSMWWRLERCFHSINCRTGLEMSSVFQSWNQKTMGLMQAHWLITTKEISGYRQWWEPGDIHGLGQRGRHLSLTDTTMKTATSEDILKTKFPTAVQEKRQEKAAAVCCHEDNVPAHRVALVQRFLPTIILKGFLMLRIYLTLYPTPRIFWLFPMLKDTLYGRHFQVVPLLHQRFFFHRTKHKSLKTFAAIVASVLLKGIRL